jgi:hypothetical protein
MIQIVSWWSNNLIQQSNHHACAFAFATTTLLPGASNHLTNNRLLEYTADWLLSKRTKTPCPDLRQPTTLLLLQPAQQPALASNTSELELDPKLKKQRQLTVGFEYLFKLMEDSWSWSPMRHWQLQAATSTIGNAWLRRLSGQTTAWWIGAASDTAATLQITIRRRRRCKTGGRSVKTFQRWQLDLGKPS